jgi:Holliday junction resolvase RusA-like endonuclease
MAGGRPILHYTNQEPLAVWRSAIAEAALAACPEPLTGPIMVECEIAVARPAGHYGKRGLRPRFEDTWPDRRPDLDKLSRAVLDALTMIVYRDDGQVVMLDATKRYCREGEHPGMRVCIAQLAQGLLL